MGLMADMNPLPYSRSESVGWPKGSKHSGHKGLGDSFLTDDRSCRSRKWLSLEGCRDQCSCLAVVASRTLYLVLIAVFSSRRSCQQNPGVKMTAGVGDTNGGLLISRSPKAGRLHQKKAI